jgi:outer membrane protein W
MPRSLAAFLLLALSSVSLSAASPQVVIKAGASYFSADGNLVDDSFSSFTTTFSDEVCATAGVEIGWTERVSTELMVAQFSPEAEFTAPTQTNDLGEIDVMPVTAVVKFRLAEFGAVAPYVGAGAAWVTFGDIDDEVQGLELEDDFTWVASAGMDVRLSERFRVGLDARYIPAETRFTAPQRQPLPLEFEPLVVSATLGYRF